MKTKLVVEYSDCFAAYMTKRILMQLNSLASRCDTDFKSIVHDKK